MEYLDLWLIGPIRFALLFVLEGSYRLTQSYGLSLIALSIIFNLLLIPAYHWAETLQQKERDIQKRMAGKLAEFNAVFKGQELYMLTRELYRQNGYHPIYSLRSIAPLLIQVPFFIAAFGLLGHHPGLAKEGFLFIKNLGQPDELLFGLNILPILMTALNVFAAFIYARGSGKAGLYQSLVIAAIFLVLLYDQPAGLVFYWTLNNLVSVLKNIFYDHVRKSDIARINAQRHDQLLGAGTEIDIGWRERTAHFFEKAGGSLGSAKLQTFVLVNASLFLLGAVTMPMTLTGMEDNTDGLSGYISHFAIIICIGALAYGALMTLVYRLSNEKLRTGWVYLGLALLLCTLGFAFIDPPRAGVLDNFIFSAPQVLKPSLIFLALDVATVCASFWLAGRIILVNPTVQKTGYTILILACGVLVALSGYSLNDRIYRKSETMIRGDSYLFNFAKDKPNVLIVFIDGAMTGFIPKILESEPELITKYEGFDWFSNVVSPGNRTINGLPSVFGGFDYTATEVNKRNTGLLREKVSAAYKLYPDNFSAKGYDVLYSDPFWFNFERKGDCEAFNAIYAKDGRANCIHSIGKHIEVRKAEIMKGDRSEYLTGMALQYAAIAVYRMAPHMLKERLYDKGNWMGASYAWKKKEDKYLNNFFSLRSLGDLSSTTSKRSTFTYISNEITRAPLFVGKDCLPDRGLSEGSPVILNLRQSFRDSDTSAIYQTTKCMMHEMAAYLDWLKANGVYDNTMIVIASDHGWASHNPALKNVAEDMKYSMFQSFLMKKDFSKRGPLKESKVFISNANVPGLVCDTIGGCMDKETGKTIRYTPLVPPVLLHETPWNPVGQNSDSYVIEALHQIDGNVSSASSWKTLAKNPDEVRQLTAKSAQAKD